MTMKNPVLELSRQRLAQLGREYMVAAQINSRVGYAKIRIDHGDDAYLTVAIPNWEAASPVYTQRMQRAMGFADGKTVKEIFKGLQLECGMSHQYFDANFELESPERGKFWLDSCGPLLETEPRGEAAVKVMCHDIEDPTFDATAVATNPRARMRPNHRPPRLPGSTGPVCSWNVFIDESAEPLQAKEITGVVARSKLAQVGLDTLDSSAESGGIDDYSGELFKKLELERFSQKALVTIAQELALQNNLLIRSMLMVVASEYSEAAALNVAEFQMSGSARLVSERLCKLFGEQGGGVEAIARIAPMHPAFQPMNYSQLKVDVLDKASLAIAIGPGPALDEVDEYSWLKAICAGRDAGLLALLQGIDQSVQVERDTSEANRWLVTTGHAIDQDGEESFPVQIGRSAIATGFELVDSPDVIRIIE